MIDSRRLKDDVIVIDRSPVVARRRNDFVARTKGGG